MTRVIPIQDETYVAETGHGVVLVDFRSDWCPPCTAVDKALGTLVNDQGLKNQVKFTSLTVNQQPLIAKALGVQSTPTLVLKKDGQIVDALVGLHSAIEIRTLIKKYL